MKNKYFLKLFIIIALFFYLIFYLWIKDSTYLYYECPSLLFYLLYSFLFFTIPGFFLCSKLKKINFIEKYFVSTFLGILSISCVSFFISAFFNVKFTFNIICFSTLIIIIIGLLNSFKLNLKIIFNLNKKITISEFLFIFIILTVVWYSYMTSYDPNEEFIKSIEEWTSHDFTSCWINATFEILDYGKYLKNYDYVPYRTIFDYPPNITFGNVSISSVFVELFQLSGWRFIYLMQGIFIGIFLYYIFIRLKINKISACFLALFCSCNPFFLNMSNPDRNAIACVISIFIFYIYLVSRNNLFLFSFISAFIITTGLRHIPIIIALPFLFIYFRRYNVKSIRKYVISFILFLFPMLVIIFHYKTGFQGAPFLEEHNFLGFFKFDYRGLLNFPFIKEIVRDPFYPFPVIFYNIIILLKLFGYLFFMFSVIGANYFFKKERKLFWLFIFIILIISLMLGVQSDWLQKTKQYPLITLFLPLFIFLGVGFSEFFKYKNILKNILIFIISFLCFYLFNNILFNTEFNTDRRVFKYYALKFESNEEFNEAKKELCNISLFPDYSRAFLFSIVKDSYFSEFKFNEIIEFNNNKNELLLYNNIKFYNNFFNKLSKEGNLKKIYLNISDTIINSSIIKKFKFKSDDLKYLNTENGILYEFIQNSSDKNFKHEVFVQKVNQLNTVSLTIFKLNRSIYQPNKLFEDKNNTIIRKEGNLIVEFPVYNESYFSIIKPIWMQFYGDTNAKHLIKQEIWTFKLKNSKIKRISYVNEHSAQIYDKWNFLKEKLKW